MRYIILFLLNMSFIGCSSGSLKNAIDNSMVLMSGNRPPNFFKVANLQTMEDYRFNLKDYTIAMPSARKEDFSIFGGWQGLTHYGKEITLYLGTEKLGYPYHITVTSSHTLAYGTREKAIEAGDIEYIKNIYHQHNPNTNISLQRYGKENYPCIVIEKITDKQKYPNKEESSFQCYKLNSTQTKAKYITLILTYNKPNDPVLAKEYTYEDLKERAKRVLDSLYIKDGWDK